MAVLSIKLSIVSLSLALDSIVSLIGSLGCQLLNLACESHTHLVLTTLPLRRLAEKSSAATTGCERRARKSSRELERAPVLRSSIMTFMARSATNVCGARAHEFPEQQTVVLIAEAHWLKCRHAVNWRASIV